MLSQKNMTEFKAYLTVHDCSESTIESYTRAIPKFITHTGKEIDEINQEDLDRYKVYLKNTYENNSLAPLVCSINAFMKFVKKPYRLSAPTKIVKNKDPLTQEEVERLFKSSKYEARDHALLVTLYYSQLRRNEIINLNQEDIDWDRQKLRVNKGKGNNYSTINLHPDAILALRQYLQMRRQPKEGHEKALFLTKYGTRMKSTAIAYAIKRHASRAKIEKRVYPHLFRISSITHMAQNGAQMSEIQRQSRHKDLETLLGYIQLSDQHVKDVYIKTLPSFIYQKKPKPKEKIALKGDNAEHRETSNLVEERLIRKLIDGEISEEAFNNAVNLLKTTRMK